MSVTVVVVGLLKTLPVVEIDRRQNRINNKDTSSEIKTYSTGLNVNKDIEECVPLVPSSSVSSSPVVASVHTCVCEDLHLSSPALIYHGHFSYTQGNTTIVLLQMWSWINDSYPIKSLFVLLSLKISVVQSNSPCDQKNSEHELNPA